MTSAERFTVQWAVTDLLPTLEHAETLLDWAWDEWFSMLSPKLEATDIQRLGVVLYTASGLIEQFLLEYGLTVGGDVDGRTARYLKKTEQEQRVFQCEELRNRVADLARHRQPLLSQLNAAMQLPDEQAIPLMQAILEEEGRTGEGA